MSHPALGDEDHMSTKNNQEQENPLSDLHPVCFGRQTDRHSDMANLPEFVSHRSQYDGVPFPCLLPCRNKPNKTARLAATTTSTPPYHHNNDTKPRHSLK